MPPQGLICGISSFMCHKKVVSIFIMLMAVFGLFVSTNCLSSLLESKPAQIKTGCPFPIYYALNESHSNSWVQQSAKGVVGFVFGVYGEDTDKHDFNRTGKLIYKTIMPDGNKKEEVVTTDKGVEKSVLLYDSNSFPHIFYAFSDNSHQVITHFYQNGGSEWLKESVIDFANEGGKFIYELSAAISKKNTIHLLVLKARSNPDSADFFHAYFGSHLYHVTNSSGKWEKTLIHRFDTLYTYDMHVKTQRRQDIAVDNDGYVHVVFGEQYNYDPRNDDNTIARLHYASNKSSQWVIELALTSSNTTDDAGWFPSLCLDKNGRPAVASTYVARVPTKSVRYTRLCYSVRGDKGEWKTVIVADEDDGYYGTDGRDYTGALPHLKFDSKNRPHIVFSDVASSHNPQCVLCAGQIRYAVLNGSSWNISTIYRQPSPKSFYTCAEMGGQCLVISEDGKKIRVVGQEMISTAKDVYTYRLVDFVIK